jgi:hypothetical protein
MLKRSSFKTKVMYATKLLLKSMLALGAFALGSVTTNALPVNLGAAGPNNWTVLEIGTGTVDMSNPDGLVAGNVGIYAGGKLQSSGPDINGNLYLGTGSTATFSGNANVNGSTFQNAASQSLLNLARADAIAAANAAKLLPGASIANITGTMTLSPGVYFLSAINLGNNEVLTLNGSVSDSFVFNISDDFKLNDSDILLSGGLSEANVLFNYYGSHDVSFSGGGNASELHGIILSMGQKVALSPGLVVGEIISDSNISIVSGAEVDGIPHVPETTSTLVLGALGFCALAAFRKVASKSSC